MARVTRSRAASASIVLISPDDLTPDTKNPRKPDQARLGLLRLSIAKLGFLMPVFRERGSKLLLSGHQRQTVSIQLGRPHIPVQEVDVAPEDVMGINLMFNRLTNDFNAFDTGSGVKQRLNMQEIIERLESMPDHDPANDFAINCKDEDVRKLSPSIADQYDKKAASAAAAFVRKGIRIPVVVSESGRVVNGVHRIFAAIESDDPHWPVVRIPEEYADAALMLLNYLSMDFHVDEEFKDLLRSGAFRRAANNRGTVPKSYRFWAHGCRTLRDGDSYGRDYWVAFRNLHGDSILDFGGGLCKVAPYLQSKGMRAIDFEPYRIDPDSGLGEPSPEYSRQQAKRFLAEVADPQRTFDSIFMSAVMNSVPFPEDRLMVLAIVNALCSRKTVVYGTCRDISDFSYEYGGIRNAGFFVFDSEPGVRLGDTASRPKIQKFMTQEEARGYFSRFWITDEYWPGGNIFYFRLRHPKGVNAAALGKALEFEFDLPFRDGTRLNLVKEAKAAFGKRLGMKIP